MQFTEAWNFTKNVVAWIEGHFANIEHSDRGSSCTRLCIQRFTPLKLSPSEDTPNHKMPRNDTCYPVLIASYDIPPPTSTSSQSNFLSDLQIFDLPFQIFPLPL